MGTGKTTVGRLLADRLGMTFLDMDAVIEEREGKPITRIFAEDGEPRFREIERALVRELAARNGLVIGTGGGIVLDHANIDDFERTGLVVCLSAQPQVILDRVMHDTTRPLLAGDDKLGKITGILEQRRVLYEAISHQVDTSALDTEQVVEAILMLYHA